MIQQTLGSEQFTQGTKILGVREQYRDHYWLKQDPIYNDRLLWRAQSFRHMVHLLPGQTILELGSGRGLFTQQLVKVTREENPITAVTFNPTEELPEDLSSSVKFVNATSQPEKLTAEQFDFIIAMELLDANNCAWFLQNVYELLKPGGQILFYESNPWNLALRLKRLVSSWLGRKDPRHLLSRPKLYELISEVGFIRVFSIFNDFVYSPLNRPLIWVLRNLSILLENTPILQNFAGAIMIHAQKPPRIVEHPKVSLCGHSSLYKSISVVIPCHNEEMNIKPLVMRLKELYGDYIYEIIPVDDNSRDRTGIILQQLAQEDPTIKPVFRAPPNGVGRAIADGYRAATGDYVLSMDCDFQHLLPELRDLFDALTKGYDVVVGSRFSRHSVLLNYPIQKIIANRGFHFLARILFLRGDIRDLTNNLKLMRREVAENLQLTQPGFAINAETGLQPLLMGYSVKEVPISWINRTPDMGISSFRLVKVGGGYWQVLLRSWLNSIFKQKQR